MEKVKVLAPFHDSQTEKFVSVGDELSVSAARAADLERNGLARIVKAPPAPKADAPAKPAPAKTTAAKK